MREEEKAGIQQELIPELLSSASGGSNTSLSAGDAPLLQVEEQTSLSGLNGYDPSATFIGTCPDCQSQLEMAEGCMKCHVCGFSECG